MRTGPFARDGSTTLPPCVNSTFPSFTSLRPAARAGSINARHADSSPDGATTRAASLGQIDALPRESRLMIACSSCSSMLVRFARRHFSEQYRTSSHERSHFFRQTISRPQTSQGFVGRWSLGMVRDSMACRRVGPTARRGSLVFFLVL